jgi:hypothetical protein
VAPSALAVAFDSAPLGSGIVGVIVGALAVAFDFASVVGVVVDALNARPELSDTTAAAG